MPEVADSRRIYKNAPIIEAAISLQFIPAKNFDFSMLEEISRNLSHEYPLVEKIFQNEFKLECGETPRSTPIQHSQGLRLTSTDQKQIIQITKDTFTFSRLAPYERWELLRDETKEMLEYYRKITNPSRVVRTGVRFINRFDFPNKKVKLSDYLNIYPQTPQFPSINGLAMQIILNQSDIRSTLVISQALIPPSKPDIISLLLDFDLFNVENRDFSNLWDFIEKLHIKKNHVFESSITEKTRKMIS